ncbi:MAG TPA: hypothetical protein VFP78_06010 [Solirubrobacteraceae bacterium]|nr:hypothetical protein [Solirubrobacteraceae bacterium]
MAYVTREAQEQLLGTVAEATDEIGVALAALGAAYEQLDEQSGDRLEAELFRPVQVAYGRGRRTHSGFAERHGLPARTFEPATAGLPSQGVRGFVEHAVEALEEADAILSELQDSMRPVEVGDPELRAGLAEVRELISEPPERARRFLSLLGR